MLITINHPELGPQKTFTSAESTAADTSISVDNTEGLASGDLVLFGRYGEERSEVKVVSSIDSSTAITVDALTFGHSPRTPIYELLFDQAEIYRATSEGGSYTLITTIDLEVDEDYTIYNDTGGTTASWYKIRYKNSQTTTTSDYSDEVQGTGFTDDSLYSMTQEVLEDFGDTEAKELTRTQVRMYINDGLRKLTQYLISIYPNYRNKKTSQILTSGTATYDLPTKNLAISKVVINYAADDETQGYLAQFQDDGEQVDPAITYSQLDPRISIRNGQLVLHPTPTSSGGYAYIYYWDYPATLSNDSDEHGLPYGARDVLVAFALYRAWLTKNKDRSDGYRTLYRESRDSYQEFLGNSVQTMTPKKMIVKFGTDLYED